MSSFDDNNGTQKGLSDVPEEDLSIQEEIETPDSSKEVEIDIEPPREADEILTQQIDDYLSSDDTNTDQTATTEEELVVLKEKDTSGDDIESLEKTAEGLVEASDKEPEETVSEKEPESTATEEKSKTSSEDKDILDEIDKTQEDFSEKTEEKQEEKKKSMPVWGWIAIAAVAVIAIILIINFSGGTGTTTNTSAELPGVWYSENRNGYALLYQFNENGTGTMALVDFASGQSQRYDFTYDANDGKMTVYLNDQSNSWDYKVNGNQLTFEAQDATENFIKSDLDLDQTISGLIDGSIT